MRAGTTKNNPGRVIKMTREVYELLRAYAAGKGPEDHVFTRGKGEPVRDFRVRSGRFAKKAGLGKFAKWSDCKGKERSKWEWLLFHDLRRFGSA